MEISLKRVEVGGIPFCVSDLNGAVDLIIQYTSSPSRIGMPVRLANAYCVALAQKDALYSRVLSGNGLNFPDGTPVKWAMKASELVLRRRSARIETVRGPSLFELTLDVGRSSGVKHFLVGSTPETLELLSDAIHRRYPGVLIVGSYSPPFSEVTDGYIVDILDAMGGALPDIVWVGLGTPKQDFVTLALSQSISSAVIGVGAAFDFMAGTVREAPEWLQNTGLEWIFRLICEPRRLWRRYLFGNFGFILAVVGGLYWGSLTREVDS